MATRPDIIQMVMIKMDELTPYSGGLVLSSLKPLKPIETTIDSVLNECVKDLLLNHPIHRLVTTDSFAGATVQSDGSLIVGLNSDFLRLSSLIINGYDRPITELLPVSDPRYALQYQKFARGSKSKPIAFREGQLSIHCFSLLPGDTSGVYSCNVVSYVLPENIIQLELLEGLSWLAASKSLTALGHIPEGQKAFEFYTLFNERL